MQLTDIQKGKIFKMLANVSTAGVAREFNIDKEYSNINSRNAFVRRVMNEVKQNPEKFGVDPSHIELVEQGMKYRRINKSNTKLPTEGEEFALNDIKSGTERLTVKIMNVLNKKVDVLLKSKKSLKETPISSLAKTFDIVHNISRLSADQSTENIAILAKTDYSSLSPEERMEMLLKKREVNEMNNVD